jgi:hypothetical protein
MSTPLYTRAPRQPLTLTSCHGCGTAVLGTMPECHRCSNRVRYEMPRFSARTPAQSIALLAYGALFLAAAVGWLVSL